MTWSNPLKSWKQWLPKRLVALSVLVGIVAGCGALLFNLLLGWADEAFIVRAAGYHMPQPGSEGGPSLASGPSRRWVLLLAPAVGGLLSGLLVYTFAPEAEGHGTDAVVDTFHHMRGFIRARVPVIKTLASALTIGSGGSAGREGPIAQIGAGFGSSLATWLKAGDHERRLLMLAGAAGGLGAVFRAPLGAAFFAAEVLYRDVEFEAAALIPGFVASIVAYSVYCTVTGVWGAIFIVPQLTFNHPLELLFYLALGGLCALVGVVHVRVFYGLRDRVFRRWRIPNHIKPAIGGLLVGIIGFFVPQVLGMGYGWTQLAIDGQLSVRLALTIVGLKIVATGLTIGSGGSGGVFAPSITIGACLGAAVGTFLHRLLPGVVAQPAAYVLVGMAGFFAGVSKTPVATLIMVSEMATGYGLLAPLMLTTAAAYLLTPLKFSIYEKQLNSRADSPAHTGEYLSDALAGLHVRDAMPSPAALTTFRLDTLLPEILTAVAASQQHVFPVLNAQDEIRGVILLDDLRSFLTLRDVPSHAIIAHDLLSPQFVTVHPDEDLKAAVQKLRESRQMELVVVEHEGSPKVAGILGRHDILGAYQDHVRQPVD
ncbi:MAG TPA: chloride channel protein [Verrucomicrobiae bacterium]|nr:chloride channel protein [Verrucomicrobiae bacterium]